MKTKITLVLFGLLALTAPASAAAHVTLQPSEAAAGDFTVLDVRVPNERDDSGTTKVDVQFPPGFIFASYQPVPGWSVKVQMEKLAKPITSHGEEITEQVAQMTWTADNAGAAIKPGQFLDFPVSVQIPGKAGDTLTFKALQTYENGEVVRWIGASDSEEPAPQVAVTEGGEEHHAAAAADDDEAEADDSEDDGGNGLAIAALIVAALALLAGGAALARSRRAT
jgi:periplasmic copper chaperone A